MMRGTRAFSIAGALALSARFAIGCATSTDTTDVEPPRGGSDDASVIPAPSDGGSASDADASDGDAPDDAATPTCSVDGWCYTTLPAPDSYDASAITSAVDGLTYGLRGVWIAPDRRVWAVSSYGHVLLWDGASWSVKAVLPNALRSIWGPSATELWVSGERGLIMHGTVTGSEVTFGERATHTTNTTQTMSRIVGVGADVWAIADGVATSTNVNRVWRLNPGSNPPSFSPTTVTNTFPGTSPTVRISALWTVDSDFWIAGYERACIGASPCTTTHNLFAKRWDATSDAGPSWEALTFNRGESNLILGATTTNDGVHLFGAQGFQSDDSVLVRVATDATKLDPSAGDGGIVDEGAYSWTKEPIDYRFGQGVDVWAANRSDVWVIGKEGLVRHFDGTSWKLVRTSLTTVTPLLKDLYDIDGVIAPSGEQDLWIVGDDVALHRKVKP
jgi:hypothetical protein